MITFMRSLQLQLKFILFPLLLVIGSSSVGDIKRTIYSLTMPLLEMLHNLAHRGGFLLPAVDRPPTADAFFVRGNDVTVSHDTHNRGF
jgi:hypothetical protein